MASMGVMAMTNMEALLELDVEACVRKKVQPCKPTSAVRRASKNGSAHSSSPSCTEAGKIGAPAWASFESSPLWIGATCHASQRSPAKARRVLLDILGKDIPGEVLMCESNPWMLSGVAFVQFVALPMEVHIFAAPAEGGSVVIIRDTSKRDVVLFSALTDHLIGALDAAVVPSPVLNTVAVSPSPTMGGLGSDFSEFDDFEDGEEQCDSATWPDQVADMLALAQKGDPWEAEALQQLARWAAGSPESRPHIANVLFAAPRSLAMGCGAASPSVPLADLAAALFHAAAAAPGAGLHFLDSLYSMAAVMKYATLSPKTAAFASEGLQATLGGTDVARHLPSFVARELLEAECNLAGWTKA
mmetsp:Transcript_61558/g.178522  ORF Transcript_61558/g.178522 Transcript_61558/m.178522 type:complete len:359 (-) Transcript_61558:193-1269(-)